MDTKHGISEGERDKNETLKCGYRRMERIKYINKVFDGHVLRGEKRTLSKTG